MKRILFSICFFLGLFNMAFGQVYEDFDDNFGFSYGTYSNIGSNGDFDLVDGLSESSSNARSGRAVRLRNDGSPSLTYTGVDDAGKDGGVGVVSFWYRHWDGDGSTPAFQVEYSTDGGINWTDIGSETIVTSTTYVQFSEVVNLDMDDVLIRIRVTDTSERIIIDDVNITNYSSSSPNLTVSETSLEDFTYIVGSGPSAEQSFTISGSNLDDDIKLEVTPNFEISTGTGGSFVATSPLILAESGGSVSETTVYVRLKSGLSHGEFADSITISTTNADTSIISLSGKVVEPFSIPYTNDFRDQDDYKNATLVGFTITSTDQRTTAGGYLNIDNGEYVQTPTIDFTEYTALEVKFDIQQFGGDSGQEFSVLISDDDGVSFDDTLSKHIVPESYATFSTIIDLTGDFNVTTGKLRFEMTDGSNSTRFRDLEINEAYAISISGDAGWRLLSLPVTGGKITDISDDTPVQGISGGDDSDAEANVFIYDETGSYEQPSDVSTPWGDGLGFGLYFFNNTINGSSELPVTLDVSGNEPATDVTVNLNAGAANLFTLVGNPFASNFDIDQLTEDAGSISDNIRFWDDGSGNPNAGDAGSTTGSFITIDRSTNPNYVISPWQGFFVETADATVSTLSFPISGKTASAASGTYFSKTASASAYGDIRFTLTSAETYDQDIRLAFREYAKKEFDRADATKLLPLVAPNEPYALMAFKSGEAYKAVESLPWQLEEELHLDMELILSGVSGEFVLAWDGLETIPSGWEVILHDYETGTEVNLRQAGKYIFEETTHQKVIADATSLSILNGPVATPLKAKTSGSTRFGITLRPTVGVSNENTEVPTEFALKQNYPNPFNPSTTIEYSINKAGMVNLSIYNLMGQKVAELVNESKMEGTYKVQWNAAEIASGMYYYRLEANGQSITRKMTLIK